MRWRAPPPTPFRPCISPPYVCNAPTQQPPAVGSHPSAAVPFTRSHRAPNMHPPLHATCAFEHHLPHLGTLQSPSSVPPNPYHASHQTHSSPSTMRRSVSGAPLCLTPGTTLIQQRQVWVQRAGRQASPRQVSGWAAARTRLWCAALLGRTECAGTRCGPALRLS